MVALMNAFMRRGFWVGNFGFVVGIFDLTCLIFCFLYFVEVLRNTSTLFFVVFLMFLSGSGSIDECFYEERVLGRELWVCCRDV